MSDAIPNSEAMFEERCIDHATVYCMKCLNENRANELVVLRARLSVAEEKAAKAEKALGDVFENLDLNSLNRSLDEARAERDTLKAELVEMRAARDAWCVRAAEAAQLLQEGAEEYYSGKSPEIQFSKALTLLEWKPS